MTRSPRRLRRAVPLETRSDIMSLRIGDTIQQVGSGNAYTVIEELSNGDRIAIRTITVSNPSEWRLVEFD